MKMDNMLNPWDERYNWPEYIYGTEPNQFLKNFIQQNKPGKILLPGNGEGRNSVYAGQSGWKVYAFDSSYVARDKALKFAQKLNVNIQYDICSVLDFETNHKFDLISLIYLHLKPDVRNFFHQKIIEYLNDDGHILLEVFSKEQICNSTGGPKDLNLLYAIDELEHDFKGMNIKILDKTKTYLSEGTHHKGEANVIRLLASKS